MLFLLCTDNDLQNAMHEKFQQLMSQHGLPAKFKAGADIYTHAGRLEVDLKKVAAHGRKLQKKKKNNFVSF